MAWSGRGKYKQPQKVNRTNLTDLPEGWIWASVEACSTKVSDGVHKKPNYVSVGVPSLVEISPLAMESRLTN